MSKWSSMALLPRPVTMTISSQPEASASSTPYWMTGLSTTGIISFGITFVAGRKRVPSPAAGKTALRTGLSGINASYKKSRFPCVGCHHERSEGSAVVSNDNSLPLPANSRSLAAARDDNLRVRTALAKARRPADAVLCKAIAKTPKLLTAPRGEQLLQRHLAGEHLDADSVARVTQKRRGLTADDSRHCLLFSRQLLQQRLQARDDLLRLLLFQRELQYACGRELAARLFRDELRQALRIDRRFLREANADRVALALDLGDADPLRQQLQRGVLQQIANGRRRRAVAIAEFACNIRQLRLRLHSCHPLVHSQALVLLGNVIRRNAYVEAEIQLRLGHILRQLAFQFADGALQHCGVQLEADGFDMAALLAAEQVSRAAQLQVESRDLESRAEIAEFFQRSETPARQLAKFAIGRNQQVSVSTSIRAADTAAQLIQLREAMAIGAIDDDRVAERDVEAILDDGGRDQYVGLVTHEGEHDALQLALRHLAVADQYAGFRDHLANLVSDVVDAVHAVVHEVDLSAAFQLFLDCRAKQLLVPSGNDSLNRHAIFRRRLDDAHVAQAEQRHVQGARNRRRRHGEHVDFFAKLLQAFLVADAEALLFVDDHQAEIAELHVFREQAVGADDDIQLACFDFRDGFFLLLG